MKVVAFPAKQSALAAFAAVVLFSLLTFGQTPQSATDRQPLNLLVLGDSVSWGQGLKDEHKAWYLVKRWLQQISGRDVYERIEAHSGAMIGSPEDNHDDQVMSLDGELSRAVPTVNEQAAVDRLRALDPVTIVPGHGPVCGPDALDAQSDYLRFVQATARRGFASPNHLNLSDGARHYHRILPNHY